MPSPAILPPSVLLMGPPGTGKTHSLTTLVEAGLDVFVLFTEAGGPETFLDALAAKRLPIDKVRWHYVPPSAPTWEGMEAMAKKVNTNSYEDLTKISSGVEKARNQQFIDLIKSCANFPDDRTGKTFGNISLLPETSALVIDSLSGVNVMCMQNTVGLKPVAHQGEWGTAMNLQEQFLRQILGDRKCWFVLTAHIDRETDEVSGGSQIYPAALGRKNGPKLGRDFSEVVLTKRIDGKFFWSTSEPNAAVKQRSLPISPTNDPSFVPLVKAFERRKAVAAASPPSLSPAA